MPSVDFRPNDNIRTTKHRTLNAVVASCVTHFGWPTMNGTSGRRNCHSQRHKSSFTTTLTLTCRCDCFPFPSRARLLSKCNESNARFMSKSAYPFCVNMEQRNGRWPSGKLIINVSQMSVCPNSLTHSQMDPIRTAYDSQVDLFWLFVRHRQQKRKLKILSHILLHPISHSSPRKSVSQ